MRPRPARQIQAACQGASFSARLVVLPVVVKWMHQGICVAASMAECNPSGKSAAGKSNNDNVNQQNQCESRHFDVCQGVLDTQSQCLVLVR